MNSSIISDWPTLLEQLKLSETELPKKTSLERIYFEEDQEMLKENDHDYAYVREEIYISPSKVPKSTQMGMPEKEETHVRLLGASYMRKVGVLLKIPNETIVIGQTIFQRFYFV